LIVKNKRQQGVALVTALIITSIAVSLAAMIMYRQQIQIRLSSNISHLEQSYLYANGMEDWAATILENSYNDHPGYDSHLDDWYTENALILPITGGIMEGKLYDLQARINLNSLRRPIELVASANPITNLSNSASVTLTSTGSEDKDNDPDKTDPKKMVIDIAKVTRERLINLIAQIDPDQDMGPPENFTDILKDWIDKDQTNGNIQEDTDGSGNGAESPYYQSLEPAYYSADTELVSPTELRLLKGMNEKIYKQLVTTTSTLPTELNKKPTKTPINVNTADEKVLRALGFDPGAVENIIEVRKNEPFKTLKEFTELTVVTNILKTQQNPQGLDPLDLDVKSNYFLLRGKVEISNARLYINSILHRKNGQVSVIMRDFSNPQSITKAIN